MSKLLIVDDEAKIRDLIRKYAEFSGFETEEAEDGMKAVAYAKAKSYDAIVLDIMMPELDGFSVCREIRKFSDVPILLLSARGAEYDKINGFECGADDYIVKPFSPKELLLKVDALTRRYNHYGHKEIDVDSVRLPSGIIITPSRREVLKNGEILDIRDKEYEVLLFLVKNKGTTVSAKEIYESVWGEMSLPSSNNTVTVHILNLRRQLEDNASAPKIIRTVWGRGYQID